ncbi:MAG: ABC transporter substrate-binding protein [Azospirillaceae bacterium]
MNRTPIRRALPVASLAAALAVALPGAGPADAQDQEREVRIAGFGAQSGVLRPFGVNSEAAMRAAAEHINESGGLTLGDGATGRIVVDYFDDRCDSQEGIATARRIASGDYVAAVGTTCSSVVEPVFGVLETRAGDPEDSGIELPVFTDVAMKLGLASLSDWGFRNVPDEPDMYRDLFAWLKAQYPEAETVYGGVEQDFVHSRQTWYDIMKGAAEEAGFEVLGESQWGLEDTDFTAQVGEMREAAPDIQVISAHPFTTCGVMMEMARQDYAPEVLVGLTSSSSPELLETCGREATGLIIPTSFAPVNAEASEAAELTVKHGGYPDLHSMAAWENLAMIARVIEEEGVMAQSDTVAEDRAMIRAGLAALQEAEGLLGTIERTPEGESRKPFVYVSATPEEWEVIHTPMN